MTDQLELATLHRIGKPQKRERHTFDFVVNGLSLFKATKALRSDLCGSLSNPQFEREVALRVNARITAMLTSDVPIAGHRVPLFVCPECGDLGCGAITALASRTDLGVRWSDFAYENGFDFTSRIDLVGSFEFEWAAYLAEIKRSDVN